MFTEGLDPHALRWVRESQQASLSANQQRMDPLRRTRTGTTLGVPPPEKFRTGRVPISQTFSRDSVSESGSDMDESSDSGPEIYPTRYSAESSPHEEILNRRAPHAGSKYSYYSSDGLTDLSSSKDTATRFGQKKLVVEEEDSGSDGSSEFSTRNVRTVRVNNGRYAPVLSSEDVNGNTHNFSNVNKISNVTNAGYKMHARNFEPASKGPVESGAFSDVPSAPPIHDYDDDADQDIANETEQETQPTIARKSNTNSRVEPSHVADPPSQRSMSSGGHKSKFSSSFPARVPTYHASVQGPWYSIFAYEACVRLCLHSWARGCMEAPPFLENECLLLRNSFGLKHILLQPEEELLNRHSSELVTESGGAPKPKKTIGRMKVQVRRVRMSLDMPTGCSSLASIAQPKLESVKYRLSNVGSTLSSGWDSLKRVRVLPPVPDNSSFSRHSIAYMSAGAQYIKGVSGLLKMGVTTLRTSSAYDSVQQETYSCQLKLKSSSEDDWIPMQPGYGESHVFFPDSLGDDLTIDVYDSKATLCGRVTAQVATIAEESTDKIKWWSLFREPEHELVGRVQLYINYTTAQDENNPLKCGSVAETVAYDITLEVAMKSQQFQQRNLLLHGAWKWLLTEFSSYYGVSDEYTRLRYLSYVMDVATPTSDCLTLVHDLLQPVVMKSRIENTLSHQENRILGETGEQIEQIVAMVFENYKSLDESVLSGMEEVYRPPSGVPAPALGPAVKLYNLLHDILSQEAQLKLCSYFQTAARKRMRRHLSETDEYISGNADVSLMDVVTFATAYKKMISLCSNTRDEIFTDIEIHNQHVLPSFIDLPNLAANIYSGELSNRLRAFLVACPPTGPSPPVADLVIATADFQKDLASWNIRPEKGVDAKELFHLYIVLWIEDKRRALLESCKLDKVKWSVRTKHMTTPFADDMYDKLNDMLMEYEVIICRWPEYTTVLENAIADVEKAVVDALEVQYSDELAPLKDCINPKKFGLKYVQKLTKRKPTLPYVVPAELGVLLNSMRRLLEVLLPRLESQLKSWENCVQSVSGGSAVGERLSEVSVVLKSKFRNYMNAVVEKLVENTKMQNATKLKKIMQESKDVVMESDIKARIQPLRQLLIEMMNQMHRVFDLQQFIAVSRGLWERMGQDVLNFLEHRKENRAWYKCARVTVHVLDDTFASHMQELLGNSIQEKDLQPPRTIMEVRSIICKDAPAKKDSGFYF
ncbi:hypothetical protein LUZ60_001230 [Juncus effusus]|nr:hypothetical protein LUZ60_001230 [Juncus effusus]